MENKIWERERERERETEPAESLHEPYLWKPQKGENERYWESVQITFQLVANIFNTTDFVGQHIYNDNKT